MKIWILGSSCGIGLELVKIWLSKGHDVIASSRKATNSKELGYLLQQYNNSLNIIDVDVVSEKSLKNSFIQVQKIYKYVDMIFYNAAVYDAFDVDNWDIKKFQEMININYLGAVRLISLLKDYFNTQDNLKLIFNCSLSSDFGLPYGGAYSASKAALVNLLQSVEPELNRKNVSLHIINHGFVNTRLTKKNHFKMPQLLEANIAAQIICKQIDKNKNFEIRFPFKLAFFLKLLKILPYCISLKITRKLLK